MSVLAQWTNSKVGIRADLSKLSDLERDPELWRHLQVRSKFVSFPTLTSWCSFKKQDI